MQIKSLVLYDYQLDHANQKFGFVLQLDPPTTVSSTTTGGSQKSQNEVVISADLHR
jgi:hypothetical protein